MGRHGDLGGRVSSAWDGFHIVLNAVPLLYVLSLSNEVISATSRKHREVASYVLVFLFNNPFPTLFDFWPPTLFALMIY